MGYVEKSSEPGEQPVYRGKLHWIIYSPAILDLAMGVALLMFGEEFRNFGWVFIAIVPLFLLSAWIRRVTTEIAMTTHRFVFKTGLIKRDTWEIAAARVEGVDVRQSILGRMLGYGSVTVRGVGTGYEPIKRVAAPLDLRQAISRTATAGQR
jgi:uncharacterized membrane protein YdbT with pleckstrin-like domain